MNFIYKFLVKLLEIKLDILTLLVRYKRVGNLEGQTYINRWEVGGYNSELKILDSSNLPFPWQVL